MSSEFDYGNEGIGRIPPAACLSGDGVASNTQRYWELGEYSLLYRQLVDFVTSVLEGDQTPYTIRTERGRKVAVRNIGSRGLRNLTSYFDLCRAFMDLYWPDYRYTADFQLFFDCYRMHRFGQWGLGDDPNVLYEGDLLAAEIFNDFVACLRSQAIARRVRKQLWEWRQRGLEDQADAISAWFRSDVLKGSRLLPIRVDLLYPQTGVVDQDVVPRLSWELGAIGDWVQVPSSTKTRNGVAEYRSRIDVHAALLDREAFFENRRGADAELFDGLVNYICKVEMGGRHHAYHLHALFLFDPAKGRDVDRWANLIHQRWSRITGGQGIVYCSNLRPDKHALEEQGLWALDPLERGDVDQLAKLEHYVLAYFAKDEQMPRVKPTAKSRMLTMGRVRK
ncbi:hypothetical protein GJQ57_08740 [Ralstonia pickettii]|uniref:Inovirus Gp2 family protein n=1 Tax=Ralstonia pickettii TaxID=329 RepID=A0A7X2HLK9_RALPI|nr:hypothetical protein [Ralstonia pickettii]MRS98742.1 hypothetical protein [Ralstonia pickettii]